MRVPACHCHHVSFDLDTMRFVDENTGRRIDPGTSNDSNAWTPPCWPVLPMEEYLASGYESLLSDLQRKLAGRRTLWYGPVAP